MKNEIIKELEKIGFRRYYKGFMYLTELIEIIDKNKTYYDFSLKKIYDELSRMHNVKASVIKADINYSMIMVTYSEYSKSKVLAYAGFSDIADLTTKKLLEVIVDKMFL